MAGVRIDVCDRATMCIVNDGSFGYGFASRTDTAPRCIGCRRSPEEIEIPIQPRLAEPDFFDRHPELVGIWIVPEGDAVNWTWDQVVADFFERHPDLPDEPGL